MNRGLLRGSIVAAIGLSTLLMTGCGATVEPTPSATPVSVADASIVIPQGIGTTLVTEYQDALGVLGAHASVVDAPVSGTGVVSLGGWVPGAAAVVTVDPVALGGRLADGIVECLAGVGVVSGPVLLAALPPGAADAATAALAQRGFTPSLPTDSAASVSDWYTAANGNVVGIVAGDATTAQAAVHVLDANAQAVKVPVVAFGLDPDLPDRLADGSQCLALRPSVKKEARAAVDLAAALSAGAEAREAAGDAVVTADGGTVPGILFPPAVIRGEGGQE